MFILGCAGAWFYSYRMHVAAAAIERDHIEGLQAYKDGDYETAVDKLAEYINHAQQRGADQVDPQALLAFAIARSKVPLVDAANIPVAINTLRRYCLLQPDDKDAQEQLLEMETPYTAYAPAAMGLASDLLKANSDDLVALKAIVTIDVRDGKFEAAQDPSDRCVQLDPGDLDMERVHFQIAKAMGKSKPEIQKQADALIAQYPNDPRFLIVKAFAYYYTQTTSETPDEHRDDYQAYQKLVLQAAQQEPPSAQFVTTTVGLLDGLRQFSTSLDLLTRGAGKFPNDPQLTRLYVERLWENRKFTNVVDLLKDLDGNLRRTDADLMAYKALSLYSLNRNSEADALVSELASRGLDDGVAAAWAETLKAQFGTPPQDLKTRLAQYQDANKSQPDIGYISFMLGDAYAQMDESELALQAWRQASRQMLSWSEPHLRLATLLVGRGEGSSGEAMRAAQDARMASTDSKGSEDLNTVIAAIRVSFAELPVAPDPNHAQVLLDEVKQVQTQIPNEPNTLPIYVALLSQTGQRDAAIDAINKAIAAINKSTVDPGDQGEELLFNLVEVSRAAKIGMEPQLYAAMEKKYGMRPRLAYAKASDLLQDGHADEGLKLLLDAQANDNQRPMEWQRVICEYRELAHDPAARDDWEKLGNAYPNDIGVQTAVLTRAESAWTDREFIDRTIDRLEALTGEASIEWKIARARWFLSSSDPTHDAPKAVELLSGVTTSNPEDYLPHVLLAAAYDRMKSTDQALEEWNKASDLAPQLPQAQFDLLQALNNAGKNDDAHVAFDKLAALPNIPPDMALSAATIIASEGDLQRAEQMLLAYPHSTNQVLHDATLAKVYRLENRPDDVTTIYLGLLHVKSLDEKTIREAADFFGTRHDLAEAQRFLDRLSDLPLAPGQKELIEAAFNEDHGTAKSAEAFYDQAVKLAGEEPLANIERIGFLFREQRWDEAQHAIDAATQRWPDNAVLADLKTAEATLSRLPRTGEYTSLIEAISRDPQSPAANDTIAEIAAASSQDPATAVQKFQALVDQYPNFEPLYELTGRRLMAAGNTAEATALANKALGRFPQSVDAARGTAEANAAAGRWSDAIIAAREWRNRVNEDPEPADLFIAVADLFVDQAQDALDRLSPYLDNAKAHPDENRGLLITYAEALIRVGRESDASALLLPLAQNSPQWREAWLEIAPAGFTDGPSAANWIAQIFPLLDPKSLDQQDALAQAYIACASSMDYTQGFAKARQALEPFAQDPAINASQLLDYATAASGSGDNAAAERAYRKILTIDPNDAIAMNNLADLLRQKGDPDSLKEGESLALQVTAAHSTDPSASSFYDTLARILLKEGRADDAIAAFEKGNAIQPRDLNVLVGLASTCVRANRIDDAARYLSQIDAIIPPGGHLSGALAQELSGARDLVRRANSHSSVTGADLSPSGK
jgi:Tfp pilus assembly protein PilF